VFLNTLLNLKFHKIINFLSSSEISKDSAPEYSLRFDLFSLLVSHLVSQSAHYLDSGPDVSVQRKTASNTVSAVPSASELPNCFCVQLGGNS
jgi:hypothetical protein